MKDGSPQDMRRQAEQLGAAADINSDSAQTRLLALRAFVLAQQAEITDRASPGREWATKQFPINTMLRSEAQRLGEAADTAVNSGERKSLAARAFLLAQEAEVNERLGRTLRPI